MDDFEEFIQHIEDEPYLPIPRILVRDLENPLERYGNAELVQRYRFSGNAIQNVILPLAYPDADAPATQRGLPIPTIIKVCIALRFFATGSFQRVCGDLLSISQASVSRAVTEVAENISRHLRAYIKFPATNQERLQNREMFYNIAGFPGVLGCIDGTHIEIKSPGGNNAEVFRNRKGWMSLNIQVVAGPRCNIQDIVIRWPGSAHDSRIFNNSAVRFKVEQGELVGILLGDSAYAQTQYVYTPVPNPTTAAEQRYNTSHITTRNVVERTFGIWKSRFRCLHVPLQTRMRTTTRIIAATAILHNIAVSRNEDIPPDNIRAEREIPNPPPPPGARGNIIRAAFIERHFHH